AGRYTPSGIPTRAAGVKGRCPRPLDDGGASARVPSSLVAVRAATWDDLELATELLAAQRRAATGVGAVRPEFVRAEWELPSFEVGRDNWVAEEGYASISGEGELKLAARDPALADELLARAVARAGERGLATLSLRVVPGDQQLAALVQRHPF